MYHKSCCLYVVTDTLCDGLLKSCKASVLKSFSTFSSRKRKRSIAVDPPLIILISGKLFIIFIFKLSKITLGKLFDNMKAFSRKKDPRSFHTTAERTYIKGLRHRIGQLFQKFLSFRAQWFIRCSDITLKLISGCLSMSYQI